MQGRLITSFCLGLLLLGQNLLAQKVALDPQLESRMDQDPQAMQNIWLLMADRVDVFAMDVGFYERGASQQERVQTLLPLLQTKATQTQKPVLDFLYSLNGVQKESIRSLWINNSIFCRANKAAILALQQRAELEIIIWDVPLKSDARPGKILTEKEVCLPNGHEWHHDSIQAPELWRMGYSGYGQSVLIIDSGVDGQHPALNTRFHGTLVPSAQAWFDPIGGSLEPEDCTAHGSHVAGTTVGLDPLNNDTIGVAPGATWMGSPAIRGGFCIGNQFPLDAMQWALNPDGDLSTTEDMPAAINNSYGTSYENVTMGFCNGLYKAAMDALEAVGVAVVFAAGNEGNDGPHTMNGQANINTTLVNSFAVGAVGPSSFIVWFTSKGPSICDANGNLSLEIKPEVVAPGDNIRSALAGGGYFEQAGTSMAAPNVCGAILLLKEAFPHLTGSEIKLALYHSCRDLGDPGEDNRYGNGLIKIKQAFDYLVAQGHDPAEVSDDNDARMLGILSPEPAICATTVQPMIQFENIGTVAFTDAEIYYKYSDGHDSSITWTGNVLPGDTATALLPLRELTTGGYFLEVDIIDVNGKADYHFIDNDAETSFSILADELHAINADSVCPGSEAMLSVFKNGPGAGPVIWYDSLVGGNEIGTGSAWLSPPLTADTTVFAEVLYRRDFGKMDFWLDNGYLAEDTDNYLVFDAYLPFTLKSVMVRSESDGVRTVELRTAGGAVIASKSVFINLGPKEIELDFEVPAGLNLQLGLNDASDLWVSTSNVYYPYSIANVVNIKRSHLDDGADKQYPFFFAWKIEYAGGCERIPVYATVGTGTAMADFSASVSQLNLPDSAEVSFTDLSTNAVSWLWNFGDGDTSQIQHPTHQYLFTGQYTVGLTITGPDGCTDASSVEMEVTGLNTHLDPLEPEKEMLLYPNPAQNTVNIRLNLASPTRLNLHLWDIQGRQVYTGIHSYWPGEDISLSLEGLSKGTYILRVQNDQQLWTEKLWIGY